MITDFDSGQHVGDLIESADSSNSSVLAFISVAQDGHNTNIWSLPALGSTIHNWYHDTTILSIVQTEEPDKIRT